MASLRLRTVITRRVCLTADGGHSTGNRGQKGCQHRDATVFTPAHRDFLRTLFTGEPRAYRLDIVTNANPDTRAAVQKSVDAGSRDIRAEPIGLEYPPGVFSLSHIAVPFPTSDPLYGLEPDQAEFYGIRLGTLALHGERNALRVSLEQLARIGSNPFYPYLEQRALAWLESGCAGCATDQPANN